MADSANLTIEAIVILAFAQFLEPSAQFTPADLKTTEALRQKLWAKLGSIDVGDKLKIAIAKEGKVTPEQIKLFTPHVKAAMMQDNAFAQAVRQLATTLSQQPSINAVVAKNVQAIYGGSATQINDPTAPVFTGPISGGEININYYSGATSSQPNTPQQSAEGANQRLTLFRKLVSLPGPQFGQVLFVLNPPPGNVPPAQAAQGERVAALLDWADSGIGCGLDKVEAIYGQVIESI